MSAVTVVGTPTWNTTAGSKTVTAVPVANSLIVVVAASSGLAGGTTSVTDDQGGTYTQVDTDRTGFSTTGVLTVWVRNALIPAATSTVFTASQAGSTGGGLAVFSVFPMVDTGAGAVRSNGGQSTGGAGTTPAPVLSNTPLAQNPIITAVTNGTNNGNTTVRNGYTHVDITGYNTPATGIDVGYLNHDETTATITWGGTSATAFASVAIELDAPPPIFASIAALTTPLPGLLKRVARYRLFPPAVIAEEVAAPLAEPIKTSFRIAVQFRPVAVQSVLRLPPPAEAALEPIAVVTRAVAQARPVAVRKLLRPPIAEETVVFIAEPIRAFYRTAVQFRPVLTQSVLRLPSPEEAVPPPPDLSDENLAPVIYGYGAM